MPDNRRRTISQQSEMIYDCHNFGILVDTREIFLAPALDESYDEAMIDHTVAHNFMRNLKILNNINSKPILVHMITCGGCWNYGIAIYDAIKASCDDEELSNIVVLAHGHSRSMSSIIPQAANLRVIMPHADFLMHHGTMEMEGNYQSVISDALWAEEFVTPSMMAIYTGRCKDSDMFEGWTEKKIEKHLLKMIEAKQEVYLSPRDSVRHGFMDAVLGDEGYETVSILRDDV